MLRRKNCTKVVKLLLVMSVGWTTPLKAQQKITADSISHRHKPGASPWVKAMSIPVLLTGAGLYSAEHNSLFSKYEIREERNEEFPHFASHADDYLQYAPIAVVYGLNIVGIKGEHDFANRTAILVKTELVVALVTTALKETTHVQRPDGSTMNSFPSGHTAQAFAAATFMSKEYGKQSMWYSVAAYSMATTVGAMRVLNNRHWVSDVLAGAGIGIASTNMVYLTHRNKWGKHVKHTTIVPSYSKGNVGVYLVHTIG